MVIANSDLLTSFTPRAGLVTAGADDVAEVTFAGGEQQGAAEGAPAPAGRSVTSHAVIIPNPEGLHARPAAVLANLAQKYESVIRIKRGDDQANAKSVMAVMGLEVLEGHKVQVIAHGPDAAQAAEELAEALREGLGEEGAVPVSEATTSLAPAATTPSAPAPAAARPARRSEDPNVLLGVAASPGLGVGKVVRVFHEDIEVKEDAADRHKERRLLNEALDHAMVQLENLENRLRQDADADKAAIFGAHREILRDPDLLDIASSAIDKGKSAAFAWRRAYTTYADRLAGSRNELLAQRATDVRDVGQRVLEEVTGQRREKPDVPEGTVLVAEDLTPSDTASLDRTKVVGFCTLAGGASSHVAILARSLDIPAVAGIEPRALDIADGTLVILDGAKGTLRINVTEDDVARIRRHQERLAVRRAEELTHANEPAVTSDGHRVEVVANIGGLEDAQEAMGKGAEGVGLLRSEFVFLDRAKAPTEDEQAELYTAIAKALAPGQPLVIRTLDVGGDKPLPYLPMAPEENPFLGQRGIRVGLDRPEVLRTQVRAILRATDAGAKIHVMFPMIATIEDFRQAKAIFEQERAALGVAPVPVGIMVEVPSVAVMAPQFAAEVDFFSVGTNDLTQYTLAMDRGHPKLAPQVDGLNPAVLGLIAQAVKAAHVAGRWVGVCGGMASDPQAVPILVGLGVDELSVSVPAIPAVKAQVRSLSLTQCQELAARALTQDSAATVRALVPAHDDEA
jgi:multiphosphoryl transfer protein